MLAADGSLDDGLVVAASFDVTREPLRLGPERGYGGALADD